MPGGEPYQQDKLENARIGRCKRRTTIQDDSRGFLTWLELSIPTESRNALDSGSWWVVHEASLKFHPPPARSRN